MSTLHTHHSKHGGNIRSKARKEKVAKKHAKVIKGLDPKVVATLLQAAFTAGELRVSANNRAIGRQILDAGALPDGEQMSQDTRSVILEQVKAWDQDAISYKDEVSSILEGVDTKARGIFADTIAVEDVEIDNNEGDEGMDAGMDALFGGIFDDVFDDVDDDEGRDEDDRDAVGEF